MILIDTSVLSRVFRRRRPGPDERRLGEAINELLAGEAELGLPGIVLQEVLSGIRSAPQFEELERRLLASFEIVLPGVSDYVEAARLRNKCLARGLALSGPDCLIATLAISGGHELLTLDRDFAAVARLSPLHLYNLNLSS